MTERRETFEPFRCRECGYVGPGMAEVMKDVVPYGSAEVLMETLGDVTCGACGSDDVEEVDDHD